MAGHLTLFVPGERGEDGVGVLRGVAGVMQYSEALKDLNHTRSINRNYDKQ